MRNEKTHWKVFPVQQASTPIMDSILCDRQPQLQIKVVSYASQSRTAKEIKEVILNHTWK